MWYFTCFYKRVAFLCYYLLSKFMQGSVPEYTRISGRITSSLSGFVFSRDLLTYLLYATVHLTSWKCNLRECKPARLSSPHTLLLKGIPFLRRVSEVVMLFIVDSDLLRNRVFLVSNRKTHNRKVDIDNICAWSSVLFFFYKKAFSSNYALSFNSAVK